tara:strand:- start:509 stop:892 length:384 start_codon:yes stop_codon:yes gene_type:complete
MAAVTVKKEPQNEVEVGDEPENVSREEDVEIEEDEEFTEEEFTDEESGSELEDGEIGDIDLDDDESLDFYGGENEDGGIEDLAGLMTELMATPDGDTICTALVNISQQLEVQNKILIKMLSVVANKK